ncbi:unnamed protein product [Staphylococcus haemolyticus JCSC1435]|uniref:Uncharacterized protein n=1 Tax=Staphylococcus haemolyticus (strain JCSC1435) TaxID=279808 RepID=Q4L3L4_STAHJ|nr:unnamed protein product [Staphylococcus haemolyticus JCSC1435]
MRFHAYYETIYKLLTPRVARRNRCATLICFIH